MPIPGRAPIIVYNEKYPLYEGRSFGRDMLDYEERVNMDRMRRERSDRFRNSMKEAGVEVMFLAGGANIRYATGYYAIPTAQGNAYAIVPREGEPIVFGRGTPVIQRRRNIKWIKPENIRYQIPAAFGGLNLGLDRAAQEYQLKKFGNQIKETLDELRLGKEILAMDTGDRAVISTLEGLGIKTSVRPEIPVKAQEIKTWDEIECLRICASIVDTVHYELAKYIEPGKTELELGGYMIYVGQKHGAEFGYMVGGMSGPYTWPNARNFVDRALRPGDMFFADAACMSWNGYLSCCYRTYSVLTKPSQAAKDAYSRIREWLLAALSDCKPGNTTADMVKHWPDEKAYWGVDPDYAWGDNLIHGIGITMYGPPHACRAWSLEHPYVLKEGHCFAIETQDGIGDGQGVRLEEMVVVTKTGYEVISRFPSDEVTVCPLR